MPICTVFIGALFCKITKPSEFTANKQSEFDKFSARAHGLPTASTTAETGIPKSPTDFLGKRRSNAAFEFSHLCGNDLSEVCSDEVVSKRALMGKLRELLCGNPLEISCFYIRFSVKYRCKNSFKLSVSTVFISGKTFSKAAPSKISLCVLALRSFTLSRAIASSNLCFSCNNFFSSSVILLFAPLPCFSALIKSNRLPFVSYRDFRMTKQCSRRNRSR